MFSYKILADINVIRALVYLKKIECIHTIDDNGNDITVYFYDGIEVIRDKSYLFVGYHTLQDICRYYVLNELSFKDLSVLHEKYLFNRDAKIEALFQFAYRKILKDYGFIFEKVEM